MAEEKQTQNSEVQVLAYTPRVARAIDAILAPLGYSSTARKGLSGRSSLTDMLFGGSGGSYEYNGPYKMILDGNRVRIVDGATYNPESKTSDDMLVYVNQKKYYAKPFVSEVKTADATFALRFTSPLNADGTPSGVTPCVEIVDLSSEYNNKLPEDDSQYVWHRVGRVLVNNVGGTYSYKIAQDHMSGDVSLNWYIPCYN